jgi:mRNA-degrading endonuclease toxin of MazEF toxin-antitoxin module
MRRGEIWWGRPPTVGRARKRRPFVVVSHDAFNTNPSFPKVMVVGVTSRVGRAYPWELELPRGTAGLPRGSRASCGEIYTFRKEWFDKLGGSLPASLIYDLDDALRRALALA